MTTDLYSTELWLDGQEVETDKLNNGQRFLRAQLTDQVLEKLIGGVANSGIVQPDFGGQNGANAPTLWAYAPEPGSAYLRLGGANNKVQIAPGTLLQKIASADGSDSTLVAYTFVGTEEFPAIANGATNPRVDLLQMKLEYTTDTPLNVDFQDAVTRANTTVVGTATKRRVLCTLSVKQGATAASPTVPDPDTGFVPVGFVGVATTWTSATALNFGLVLATSPSAIVHDVRMPLGVRAYRVDPTLFKLETAWALETNHQYVSEANATNVMMAECQHGTGRIIGIAIEAPAVLATAPTLGLLQHDFTLAPSVNFVACNTLAGGGTAFSNVLRYLRSSFEANHAPIGGAGATIQPSAVNGIGVPIWANGTRVPQDNNSTYGNVTVRFLNQPNPQKIGGVIFYVAGGL